MADVRVIADGPQMGKPAARLVLGVPPSLSLLARGVFGDRRLADPAPAGENATHRCAAEQLPAGVGTGSAGRCAAVGRAGTHTKDGRPRAELAVAHCPLSYAQGNQEARPERHRAAGDSQRTSTSRSNGPRSASQQRNAALGDPPGTRLNAAFAHDRRRPRKSSHQRLDPRRQESRAVRASAPVHAVLRRSEVAA